MNKCTGLLVACCLLSTVGRASALEGTGIWMAVREDAKPFAWQEQESGSFRGYLFELCTEAVEIANYVIADVVPTQAKDREVLVEGAEEIDLVCDPMTITVARARQIDFSPIVFIANSTFVTSNRPKQFAKDDPVVPEDCLKYLEALPNGQEKKVVLAGMVIGTTSVGGFEAARKIDASGFSALPDDVAFVVCKKEVRDHITGIRLFCSGELGYYFGDIDIIRAYLADHPQCDYSFESAFLQYEPYALALTSTGSDSICRRLSAAVFYLFSTGAALEMYNTYFSVDGKVRPMAEFFKCCSELTAFP